MSDATNIDACVATVELSNGTDRRVIGRYELPAKCEWPGCTELALCQSGNLLGLLVCLGHFEITNGDNVLILMPESGREN